MEFTQEHIARFKKYENYEEIRSDLAKESERAHARDALKLFFRNIDSAEPKRQEAVIKALVHGLADDYLPPRDRLFFQTLLYLQPRFTANHLIGGLRTSHHNPKGAIQRISATKRLLRRKRFATQETANKLIGALKSEQIREHVTELLQHPNYATQQTANNLIAALEEETASAAKELLQHEKYATQETANNLIGVLDDPIRREAAQEILQHQNYASQQTANNLVKALENPEQADSAKKLLKHLNYVTQETADNLIGVLHSGKAKGAAKELLQHEKYATQETANNLIAALKDPEASEHVKELLRSKSYARIETLNNMLMLIESEPESEKAENAMQTIEHASYLGNQELVNKMIHYLVFKLGSKKDEQIKMAEQFLGRLKIHKSVRNALNGILNQPPGKLPKVKVEFSHADGKVTQIDHVLSDEIVKKIRRLLSQAQATPKKKKR